VLEASRLGRIIRIGVAIVVVRFEAIVSLRSSIVTSPEFLVLKAFPELLEVVFASSFVVPAEPAGISGIATI